MKDFDLTAEYIDIRDVIERAEEIEIKLAELAEKHEIEWEPDDGLMALAGHVGADDLISEAETIRELLADLRGCGGDHQWRGDWYPVTLIREDAFEGYMDEMLEDIGAIPKEIPCYVKIEIDYDALKMDYSEVEIDGETYLYR